MKQTRAILCICLLSIGTRGLAQKVDVDFDKGEDFKKFRTFAWKEGKNAPNPLADRRIREIVEMQLGSKGLRRALGVEPDCLVVYHASTEDDLSLNMFYSGWGAGWYPYWGAPTSVTTTVDRQRKGTLIVDVWDAATKKLAWRGVGEDTLSDKPEKNSKKVQKVVAKMFKQFPPAQGNR